MQKERDQKIKRKRKESIEGALCSTKPKRQKKDKLAHSSIGRTLHALGAVRALLAEGFELRGVLNSRCEGIVLEVPPQHLEENIPSGVPSELLDVEYLEKSWKGSTAQREYIEGSDACMPGQKCLHHRGWRSKECGQKGCTPAFSFRLIAVNKELFSFARKENHTGELDHYLSSGECLSYIDAMYLFGLHPFYFSTHLFEIVPMRSADEVVRSSSKKGAENVLLVYDGKKRGTKFAYTSLEGVDLGVAESLIERGSLEGNSRVVIVEEVFYDMWKRKMDTKEKELFSILLTLSSGDLKSLLQKVCRLRAQKGVVLPIRAIRDLSHLRSYSISPDPTRVVHPPVVASLVFLVLATDRGGYVEQLHKLVTGAEAAFKRLSIILLEDALVDPTGKANLELMAISAYFSCMGNLGAHPSKSCLQKGAKLAMEACKEDRAYILPPRTKESGVDRSKLLREKIDYKEYERNAWKGALDLLVRLGSFPGDYQIFHERSVADQGLAIDVSCPMSQAWSYIPLVSYVCYHNVLGIVFAPFAMEKEPVDERKRLMFQSANGNNSRRVPPSAPYPIDIWVVQELHHYYKHVSLSIKVPESPVLQRAQRVSLHVPHRVDEITVSVGPLRTANGCIAVIGKTDDPKDVVVFSDPSASKNSKLPEDREVTEEEYADAVEDIKRRCPLPMHHNPFKKSGVVKWNDQENRFEVEDTNHKTSHSFKEFVNSHSYIEVQILPVEVPIKSTWNREARTEDSLELAIFQQQALDCLLECPKKLFVSSNYEEHIQEISKICSAYERQRLISVLETVGEGKLQLGVPPRGDTQQGGQGIWCDGDHWIYWILFRLSLVFPSALFPDAIPSFKVRNERLLRWVLRSLRSAPLSFKVWRGLSRPQVKLLPHQEKMAVQMEARKDSGAGAVLVNLWRKQ
uniref:Uncharacterized protein n=1 Tax=Palpitomonas bilix TaxID=652834 RepID=A0A7S3D084_9EUKA|mmetsp:Transcript_16200/g.41012  ORF Transcript_16200/g.41012 Transcript_16200/m.41012 type:complete len:913 (+) Transcript_16200:198-2936(+)